MGLFGKCFGNNPQLLLETKIVLGKSSNINSSLKN